MPWLLKFVSDYIFELNDLYIIKINAVTTVSFNSTIIFFVC